MRKKIYNTPYTEINQFNTHELLQTVAPSAEGSGDPKNDPYGVRRRVF